MWVTQNLCVIMGYVADIDKQVLAGLEFEPASFVGQNFIHLLNESNPALHLTESLNTIVNFGDVDDIDQEPLVYYPNFKVEHPVLPNITQVL